MTAVKISLLPSHTTFGSSLLPKRQRVQCQRCLRHIAALGADQCCFSAEVAAASLTFFALRLCLTSRISSQQFLEQATAFIFKSSGACNGYRTSDRCQHWSKAVSQRRSYLCLSAQTRSIHLKKSGGRALVLLCSASKHLPA